MKEQEIVECLTRDNEEYKKLIEEHHQLEADLSEIDRKVYLTPEEEVERKRIQKLKLQKKDRMAEMVRDYKKSAVGQ